MSKRAVIALCSLLLAATASASELVSNGGFETGTFSSWLTTDSSGSGGSFFVSSAMATPLNGFPTVGAATGTDYAVSDAFAPGSHALTQTFTDPLGTTSLVLSFNMFVNDQFGGGGTGGEVDLLAAGANALTGTAITVCTTQDTAVSGGAPNPYVHYSCNISAFLTPGVAYQLRVLESDTNGPINVGIDDLSLIANPASGVPEPSEFLPLALAIALGIHKKRRTTDVN